jgi:bifunctional non-homologous end joining protein LigD
VASRPPSGANWVHEIKHDGYRLIVRQDGVAAQLFTRNAHDWTARLPAIATAAARIKARSFTIDGEAVVLGPDGLSRFDELRRREAARTAILYAFDLIEHDGEDLCNLPFLDRKAALARLLRDTQAGILLNEHVAEDGPTVFAHACRLGAEGIEAWVVDRASWDLEKLGPPPDARDHRVPLDIAARFADRRRKREERRRDREVALARQAAADRELRDRLIAAANGNYSPGPGIDDLSPIKSVLEIVPLDRVLTTIRCKVDKRSYPANPTLVSWRDPVLLKEIAENYCRTMIVPNLVAAWAAAGKTPGKPVERVAPSPGTQGPAASHTAPAAPPGNGIAPFTDAAAEPGPPAAVQVPAAPESGDEKDAVSITDPIGAPTTSPPQPADDFSELGQTDLLTKTGEQDDGASKPPDVTAAAPVVPAPQSDDRKPVAEGRQQVLAAFARSRAQALPQPAPPQPRPDRREAAPAEPEFTAEGWMELVGGYVAGNVNWNTRRLGAPPGSPNCRAPRDVLRSFGL